MKVTNRSFTKAEDKQIVELYFKGQTATKIAQELGRARSSLRDRGIFLGLDWDNSRRLEDREQIIEDVNESLLRPIRMEVTARQSKALINNLPHATLVYGDIHFPFQDEAALEVLYKFVELVDIDHIIDLGDLIDNWQISSYIPPDEKRMTPDQKDLAYQFQSGAKHLAQLNSLAPRAVAAGNLDFLEGNHEERWTRMLRKAQTDYTWRHVLSLPAVREVLDVQHLMGIKDLGYSYAAYGQGDLLLHDRLVVTHGHRTTIWASRQMLEQYGKSVIFGHTHRIQNFTKTDLRATDSAWNIGCLCDLNPMYGKSSAINWAQGFSLVVWNEDYSQFSVIQLRIHNGQCVTPYGEIKV